MYLACGLDCFAERAAAGLAVEDVRYEEILCRVHDESALLYVLADAKERQVAHSTLGYELVVLKHAKFLIIIICCVIYSKLHAHQPEI